MSARTDVLRADLTRGTFTLTIEVVTPPRDDAAARARILRLADAVKREPRVASLALTDRTIGGGADDVVPVAEAVADASGKVPLVVVAGKGRDRAGLLTMLRRLARAGLLDVVLTGGDPPPPPAYDAVEMVADARAAVCGLLLVGVIGSVADDASYARASEKTVSAFVAQVTWDLAVREAIAAWQASLAKPILGAVMPVTPATIRFLVDHTVPGIVVPPALARRVEAEGAGDRAAAERRLALDLLLLRRLGYAGAHVSGLTDPARLCRVLDELDRLDAALGTEWPALWREAAAIA